MTQGELDRLRESHSFPQSIQIRLPEVDETIVFTRSGEVAFYEATFHASLRLPLHPIIRRILYFYNICPTQLVPYEWRSLVRAMVLYFKARSKKTLLRGYSNNVKGWKKKFFFILGDDWEFSMRISRGTGVPRVLRLWGTPSKRCNKLPVLSTTEQKRIDKILESFSGGNFFTIKEVLESKSFRRCFKLDSKSMASSDGDNGEDILTDGASLVAGDEGDYVEENKLEEARSDGRRILGCKLDSEVDPSCEGDSHWREMPQEQGMVKAPTKAKASLSKAESKAAVGEGTSANPGVVLGLKAFMLGNPAVVGKLLEEVILPADKEEVEKLDLDWAISQFFHRVGGGACIFFSWARQRIKGRSNDLDATMARLEAEIAKLKKKVIVEFKASDEFQETVEFIAFRYFGEDFDFCKRQISHLHPDLNIQGMGINADLLEEEEKHGEKEGEKEEEQENEDGEKGSLAYLSSLRPFVKEIKVKP
ncbi:hypothetical protein Acr_00g0021730 [Actinidia rufa]|uniref:Uncharacterized protein n=1 Tax=Actinidia rufa TaxID=165716 RepID=A0A7J0DE43_9ERIC|nr:hypothetical protein Acr_00g0021730 [Actinidia rufa]